MGYKGKGIPPLNRRTASLASSIRKQWNCGNVRNHVGSTRWKRMSYTALNIVVSVLSKCIAASTSYIHHIRSDSMYARP